MHYRTVSRTLACIIVDRVQIAKVRILPERVLGDPLEGAHSPSYRRICCCKRDTDPLDPLRLDSGDHKLILQQWLTANKRKKVRSLLLEIV